jgi:hypothetical protein
VSQHTPDSWIESHSHWSGRDPSDSGYCSECGGDIDDGRCACNPCEIGTCDHFVHCDNCGREMPRSSPTGNCFICDFEWMAARQLAFPSDKELKEPTIVLCPCGGMHSVGEIHPNGKVLVEQRPFFKRCDTTLHELIYYFPSFDGRLSSGVHAELNGEGGNKDAASSLFTGESISPAQIFANVNPTRKPSRPSMSLAEAKDDGASEGPEDRDGNKPLMRNRTANTASDASLQDSPQEIVGISAVLEHFYRRFGIND